MTAFPQAVIEAAWFEARQRERAYPKLVLSSKLSAEEATLDFHAWVAIAQWVEHGRSSAIGNWGGVADPPSRAIDWDLLEASAAKALKAVDDLIAEKGEDAARMQRRASLVVIHQAVAFQREWLSETNRQLREQAEARIAARAKAAA
jgi:hypothetical protein